MFKVVVGHSEDPDSQSAIEEVLSQCTQALDGYVPQAGILFAAIDFDHALILNQIQQDFPQLELVGCTTDGEMSSTLGFQQDSLSLMLFYSDTVGIHAGVGYSVRENPGLAAQQAVQQATGKSSDAAKLCMIVPASYLIDGSTTSGVAILEGLKLALGNTVPIVGGAAGDQFRFRTTYQFFGSEVLSDALPILVFSGEILFSHGIACGWQPIGRKSKVTRADKTLLYEIDGKPALEFYQSYLGNRPPTAEHPLAVYEENSNRYYMRVPNTYDAETGSINFLSDVPEEAMVCVTEASRDEIIAAAASSFKIALESYPGAELEAVVLFSCCCRRWLLGTRAGEEYQVVKETLSADVPIFGFYTYGEFAPLEPEGTTYYHQETFVTLLLGTK